MANETKGTRVLSNEVKGETIIFKVAGVGELTLDTEKLSAEVKREAMFHGLVQRVSDRAAISRDTATGKSASPEDKFNAMKVLVEHYNTGTTAWNLSGGERGPSDEVKLLIEALCEVYTTKSKEDITAWVRKRSKEELAALQAQENLKTLMDKRRAERAKGVDAGALLSELA